MDAFHGVSTESMKRIFLIVILLGLMGTWTSPTWSHNPFTSKPETQHKAPEPLFKSQIFVKTIFWQHQLKRKMSELIRISQSEGRIKPLIVLLGIAFTYGVLHAAGPGHGKVVAMTYVLTHRASILGGILFGTCFAFIHASSGAIGVLGLKYIIQSSFSETLVSATTITQLVSFSLITILGLSILYKHACRVFTHRALGRDSESNTASRKGVISWSVAVGLVPCPAVVMVMLFCLSMDVMALGLLLAACISIGMATTISFVVITIVLGKAGVLATVSEKYAYRVEGVVGVLSGGAIVTFGAIFLLSTINTILA
jgi:ABC-type nickel/cobalt efflux system permease component RcnA